MKYRIEVVSQNKDTLDYHYRDVTLEFDSISDTLNYINNTVLKSFYNESHNILKIDITEVK